MFGEKRKNVLAINPRLASLLEEEGYKSLNYIQRRAFNLVRIYENLVIVAPTGSGKTEAAFFPILNELLENGGQPIYALYITPLRALNRDIHLRMKDLIERLGYRVEIRHGDTPAKLRRKIAEKPPHFLITTPETLQFLLVGKRIREALRNVGWIVVDELHELMDNKRGSQLTLALQRLKRLARKRARTIALSATISDPDLALKFVSGRGFGTVLEWREHKGYSIMIDDIDESPSANDTPLPPEFYSRMKRLAEYASRGGVLIFTNTRDTAELIGRVLRTYFGLNVRVHHGSLSKEERVEVEELFKRGEIKAVVATSSLELGIDIGHVNLVVQYASPRQAIRLVQRVGRAGHRLGEVSRGIIIPIDLEDAIESAVLARRAERGNLEELRIHEKPLDVLAHQIAGLAMEYGVLETDDLYDLVTRAYPYRELSLGEMEDLLRFMDSIRTIRYFGSKVRRSRRTLEYYFSAASTIPESLSFDVVDTASRRVIGHLDYSFISMVESEKVIILAGRSWLIEDIDYEKNRVLVSEYSGEFGEPPLWTGEMLPVEYKAAREVASVYRRLADSLGDEKALSTIRDAYGVPAKIFEKTLKVVRDTIRSLGVMPSDKNLVVETKREGGRTYMILHSFLGTRGNNLLALLLSYSLRAFYSCSARYFTDPYRVMIITDCKIDEKKARTLLLQGIEWALNNLSSVIRESNPYMLKLIQVAGRIGVLEKKKTAKLEQNVIRQIKHRMGGTPLDVEAIKEVLVDYFDLEAVRELLEKLEARHIPLIVREVGELSPLSQLMFDKPMLRSGLIASSIPLRKVVEVVKKRLENSRVKLVCLHCGEWSMDVKVSDTKRLRQCPRCGSRAIAVLRVYDLETLEAIKKWKRGEKLSREERKLIEKARLSASLYTTYGYRAALVLAGHGVGPTTATKILSFSKDIDTLVRDVLKAETEFSRTRKYWD